MTTKFDWDDIRRRPFAEVETPDDWPRDVRPVNSNGTTLIGVDQKGQLYWDGQRIQTVAKLGSTERWLAIAVTVATVSMAVLDAIRFIQGN